MKQSKFLYNKSNNIFDKITPITGVCSAVTLSDIHHRDLRRCTRDELQYHIVQALKAANINWHKIKTVQITLNQKRSWCWGTPWKFAYSYEGNSGHCSVFYINFED